MKKSITTILAIGTLLACFLSVVRAEETQSSVAKYFTDIELVNRDGKHMRFFSDVLKGKTAIIHAFSTASLPPILISKLAKIQTSLGERVAKDVVLVSITDDPETDTPEKLNEFARKNNATPGWMYLTGQKENVQTVLKKLGLYEADKSQHSMIVIIGNEPTGLWKKASGLASPEELLKVVKSVANDKQNSFTIEPRQ